VSEKGVFIVWGGRALGWPPMWCNLACGGASSGQPHTVCGFPSATLCFEEV